MTCKDCIHYDACLFHLNRNENEQCRHFKNKADFVEVVRCKDCKHFMEYSEEYIARVEGADGDCYVRLVCSYSIDEQLNAVRCDDFCSYGKRKESE